MKLVMRVSVSVVAFLLFQTADCGLAGRLMRQSREQGWANMTPQQQIRAVDDFFVSQGQPSQLPPRPAPAPVAVPAQCGASASDSNEGSNERVSFDPSSVNESDQSDLRNSQVVSRFPTPGDDIFDDFIGKENNVVEGTVLWLIEQFYSPGTGNKRRKNALTQFLKSHEFFSGLQSARGVNKVTLTAKDLKKLMDEAGDDKEAKVLSVYNELARAVKEAERKPVEAE